MSDETQTPETEDSVDAAANAEADANAAAEANVDPKDARIAELEAETAQLKDQLLRALAETENVRKRSAREVTDAAAYGIEKFAKDMLSVSDNLTRALAALDDEARAQLSDQGSNLLEGVEMTQKDLHAALSRNHVVAVDAAPGATFDPNMHQAVSRIPSDQPANTVAASFQTGWKIKDRVLRAAMVAVSLGPASASSEEQPEATQN